MCRAFASIHLMRAVFTSPISPRSIQRTPPREHKVPDFLVCSMIEALDYRVEELLVVVGKFNLVGKGLDARVLEGIERLAERANVVDSPLLVRIIQIVWRPAVVLARRMIARFDKPNDGVQRLALVVPVSHRSRPLARAIADPTPTPGRRSSSFSDRGQQSNHPPGWR